MESKAVLSGMLYIPTQLVSDYAYRNFTFPNPKHQQALKRHVKNPKEPQFITSYRRTDDYVGFPPYADRTWFFPPGLEIEDRRSAGQSTSFNFNVEAARGREDLFEEQLEAKKILAAKGYGILRAPPGSGKTNVGIWIASQLATTTIILVHTGDLANQWYERFWKPDPKIGGQSWTNLKKEDICLIGDGKKEYKGQSICIATFQTMYQNFQENIDLNESFGAMISDECLSKDTIIATPHGEALFSDINIGHRVWSFNFSTREMEEDEVIAISEKQEEVYEITITIKGREKRIRCSGNHPFFNPKGQKIQAQNLQVGDEVLTL